MRNRSGRFLETELLGPHELASSMSNLVCLAQQKVLGKVYDLITNDSLDRHGFKGDSERRSLYRF